MISALISKLTLSKCIEVFLSWFILFKDIITVSNDWIQSFCILNAGTVFAYGVTSSGKTHTMHVSCPFSKVSSIFAI